MLNLILKIYRNYKNTNFKEIWKRIGQLPIHIIVLFTVLLISAILSFVAQAKLGNSKWCWILMAIELGSTIALGFTSEKHSLDNSKENMNDYLNECQTMYKEVFQKYDDLKKINQILIIPIILAIIKALWDSTSDISMLMETSLLAIMFYLTVYAFIIAAITLINYDIVWQKNKLQSFVDDLQGIIDSMVIFQLSDNMLTSNEEAEVNNGNTTDRNNEGNG